MSLPRTKLLDTVMNEAFIPALVAYGFVKTASRRYERARPNGGVDVIEVQLGQRSLAGFFCINAFVLHGSGQWPSSPKRLGSGLVALMRVPQIVLFSPLSHLLIPIYWPSLITDSWYRMSQSKIYLRVAFAEIRWLFSLQGLRLFKKADPHA